MGEELENWFRSMFFKICTLEVDASGSVIICLATEAEEASIAAGSLDRFEPIVGAPGVPGRHGGLLSSTSVMTRRQRPVIASSIGCPESVPGGHASSNRDAARTCLKWPRLFPSRARWVHVATARVVAQDQEG